MVFVVFVRRYANLFVLAGATACAEFAEAIKEGRIFGAVEPDLVATRLGVRNFLCAAIFCATESFTAAVRFSRCKSSHAPAASSRHSKIQNVRRERIIF